MTFDVIQVDPNDVCTPLEYTEQSAEALQLPGYDDMLLRYQMFPDSIPKQLADAAGESQVSITADASESQWSIFSCRTQGLSGRTLRRLPALSLVLHTHWTTCTIHEAVAALQRGIASEQRVDTEMEGNRSQAI